MPDDGNGPKDNVPQESVQDADHFGKENELPDADKGEYWSQVDDAGVQAPDAPLSDLDAGVEEGEATRVPGSNSYGSLAGEGQPSSGATVDPSQRADADGE